MKENQITGRVELLRMLTSRLERLSVDSIWARRASGLRGSLIKALEMIDTENNVPIEHQDILIEKSFEILRNAAREIPDAEAQWRKLQGNSVNQQLNH
ncbi:MAG: hypothetical protein WCP19_06085 [Chloroflexota bacterium]